MNFNPQRKYFYILLIFLLLVILCFYYYYLKQLKTYKNIDLNLKNKLEQQSMKEEKKLNDKKNKEKQFLNSIDFKTDSSLNKFVSAKVPFNDKTYIPENLVNISGMYIIDGKGGGQKLRKDALEALEKMGEQYYKDTGKKIVVVSAYRSYLYQKGIKDRGCPDNLCAKAGYSEHQSGLAVDLWAASSNASWQTEPFLSRYKWLKENAYKYGFHNTYQKGLEVDTYEIEPWHWRYLGEPLAKYLLDNDLTIAEFYNKMEQH